MYGYYDQTQTKTHRFVKAVLGLGAVVATAATASAFLMRRGTSSVAEDFGRRVLAHEATQRVITSSAEGFLNTAERFQSFLEHSIGQSARFETHFQPQEYVNREDHTRFDKFLSNLPSAEYQRHVAEQLRDPDFLLKSAHHWSDEKIDAMLRQGGAFQALLQEETYNPADIRKLIMTRGSFQKHLQEEALRDGKELGQVVDETVHILDTMRRQLSPRPPKNTGEEDSALVQTVRALYQKRLAKEANSVSWLEEATGISRARVSKGEADTLRGETGGEFAYEHLRSASANARFLRNGREYDFSALRSLSLSAKNTLSDRFQIPLSPFQTGISLGQLFPFIGRLGDRPLMGIYDQGLQSGSKLQAFFEDRLITLDHAADTTTLSEERFTFLRPNKGHIKHLLDAQEEALETGRSTLSWLKGLRGGIGRVEEGTSPYWDKPLAFFRKFTADDYLPNILKRASLSALKNDADTLALSSVMHESGLETTDSDLVALLTRAQSARAHGRKLIHDITQAEFADGQRQGIPETMTLLAERLSQSEDTTLNWASSSHLLSEMSETYHKFSPRVRKQIGDLSTLNQNDRIQYLKQTASYEDSRKAETLFGLELGGGTHRVTNLDILRSDLLSDMMREMQGSLIDGQDQTYETLSAHLTGAGRYQAAILAEGLNVDRYIATHSAPVSAINAYLSGANKEGLRLHLETESRRRFNILHTHPKAPKETQDFTERARVLALRKSTLADWIPSPDHLIPEGFKRTFRAYTSPTSIRDGDATSGSFATYFFADRLHTAFKEIGLGLSPASAATPVTLINGLIFGRFMPLLGILEAHKAVNRITRDVKPLNLLNPDLHRANVLDFISRLTHKGATRRKLLALIPGLDFYTDDRSSSEEARAQRGAGYTAVRRGRWWAFGSREAFFGDHVSYYAPSASRFARSDWQAASNVKRNDKEYWKHFGGYLNPMNWGKGAYWWEESQKRERPYVISGEAFDPDHPWNTPLNALFGRFLKPRKVYHPEYLPKHLGGTLEDIGPNERPTSPFAGRIVNDSKHDSGRDTHGVRRRARQDRQTAPRSATGSRGSDAGIGASTGVGLRNSRGQVPMVGQTGSGNNLSPGYVLRIPRARKLRDASNDPLRNRLNLNRSLDHKKPLSPEEGVSPEEQAYIRSIHLDNGFSRSLYHLQEIAGLYGWFGSLVAPGIAQPEGKVEVASASRGYGRERRFYDQEIGGLGGNISDVLRRFLPHRRRAIEQYDPVPNNMPSWLPGADYLGGGFKTGDPFSKIPLGEARLPGSAYTRLHPGTSERMLRIRASSIGKSQAEMEAYLTQKEGEGDHFSGGSAAEMGTKMHRVLQERWRKLGLLEGDEIEVFDSKLNVSGHIDAILRLPDNRGHYQRTIVDIKTKTQEKFEAVRKTGRPEDENLDQILFYMHTTGIKRGMLTYINRENVNDVFEVQVKFDQKRFDAAVKRMEAARANVLAQVRSGALSEGALYDPLSKMEILADVAPYSNEFKRMQEWAERNKGSLTKEDQGRLEDLSTRVHRQKQGFELHPIRFAPKAVRIETVRVAKFIGRDTIQSTSGQNYRIAGITKRDDRREVSSVSTEDWWKISTGIQIGSKVKVLEDKESSDRAHSNQINHTARVALYVNGRNIGRQLIRSGAADEDRQDYSAPARLTRFTHFERTFGRIAEYIAHLDTPINTKFLPARTGLEQYTRTDVYGKRSGSWENPVASYVWPTLTSFANKNPLAGAAMGAAMGTLFFLDKKIRVPAMQIGAIAGASLAFGGMILRAVGHPFIARAVRKRRKMDEYYDTLTYVKYRRLAAIEEKLARHDEQTDVDELDGTKAENVSKDQREHVEGLRATKTAVLARRDQLRARIVSSGERHPERTRLLRRKVDALEEEAQTIAQEAHHASDAGRYAIGPHAQQALLYRQRYRATVRGALEGSSWDAALSALPKPTRSAIIDVIQHGSQRDKNKLYTLLPQDQKAVLGFALNIDEKKIPTQESLLDFFRHHALPDEHWAGWRADASLDFLKARDVVRTRQDPSDFGIFPSTISEAVNNSPEARIALPSQAGARPGRTEVNELRAKIHSLLEGHGLVGLDVSVTEEEGARGSHEADVNIDVSQRREHAFFNAYKSSNG